MRGEQFGQTAKAALFFILTLLTYISTSELTFLLHSYTVELNLHFFHGIDISTTFSTSVFLTVEVNLLFEAHVECQPNLDPLEC